MGLRALAILGILVLGCRTAAPPPASSAVAPVWPRTVAEAVELRLSAMSESEKATIRAMPRERVQDLYHGFQMQHRAEFGLGEGNQSLLASCGSVQMPAEECMRVILDAMWLALQGTRELTGGLPFPIHDPFNPGK